MVGARLARLNMEPRRTLVGEMLSAHLVGADRCSGERGALRYAAHLALRAVKRDGVFTLSERYGGKKKIGTFAAHRPEKGEAATALRNGSRGIIPYAT